MPKTDVEVPEDTQHWRYEESPFEKYPGWIKLPQDASPQDFKTWWKKEQARSSREDDPRHPFFQVFECINHLIKDFHMKGLTSEHLSAKDGSALPTMQMVVWATVEANKIVQKAVTYPNSSTPSTEQ